MPYARAFNRFELFLGVLFVATAVPVFPQASPTAMRNGSQVAVGAGVSYFKSDWSGRLVGPTGWVDWNFYNSHPLLRGFGLEVEAQDLNYERQVYRLRQDTAAGGPIYTWRRYRNFDAYGKFLVGRGSIDPPGYPHFARTIYVPGGGAEFRMLGRVWVRGDYQYQLWPNMVHDHFLNPTGITVGASYRFGHVY